MKGLNPSQESGRRNGVVGLGLRPDHASTNINIKVSHVQNQYEVSVPSNSRFGDLKSVIAKKIGLNPETLKLLFRGKEKEDDEDLQTAGVKENSKVLIMEDKTCKQEKPEEVEETCVISRGGEAVAKVREEVDKLSKEVSALQAVVDSGAKVDEKEIIYLSEMLMRQLLKLDGIDAEGEGRVQRKMEVRRVQSLVDTVDLLKSRNSNPSSNVENIKSETTQWESFEPACGSAEDSSPQPPSAPPQPSSAPSPQPPSAPPQPSSAPSPQPPSAPPQPSSAPSPQPPSSHSPQPPSSHSPQPPCAHSPMPSSNLSPTPSYASAAVPSYSPYSYTPPVYGHSPHDSNPYAHSPHDHNPYGHSSHDHISYAHSPYNPYLYAPNPYASHHPNPHAPNPYAPSSHHPNPPAPNPYAPSSHYPNPQAPNPYAPSSHNPNPYAPSSHDPNPYASSSHDHNLHAPNPFAPSSHNPNPHVPNSYAPNPYASNPYATSSHTPPTIPSNDPSPMQSYDPSYIKVNKDWEHFE